MKALSLKQPWAELIIRKKKTIEIRKWRTNYRGKLYIHASRSIDKEAMNYYGFSELLTGVIIGYVEIFGIKTYKSQEEFIRDKPKHLSIHLPQKYPVYGFLLRDIHRIKPIPLKGKLGIFEF